MNVKLKILAGGYFFVFLTIYASHNYLHEMYKNVSKMSSERYALMDLLFIVKFFGAAFISNLADRTMKHSRILLICIVGYIFFFFLSLKSDIIFNIGQKFWLTITCRVLSFFFLSGVFPLLDVMCLNYLEEIDQVQACYGRIRMASCLGHSLGTLSAKIGNNIANIDSKESMPLYFTSIFGVFCFIFIWITFDIFKAKNKVNNQILHTSFNERLRKNIRHVKKLFSINILVFFTAVILQGIYRQAISNYLETHFKNNGILREKSAIIFAIRCIPEALMLYVTPFVEQSIGIYWMFFISIIFGITRPLIYGFGLKFIFKSGITYPMIYALECSKGIFSALFSYSASKIVKEMASQETKSLAQGLYNGCYSGIAPFISGIICLLYFNAVSKKSGDPKMDIIFSFVGILGAIGLFFAFALICLRKKKVLL